MYTRYGMAWRGPLWFILGDAYLIEKTRFSRASAPFSADHPKDAHPDPRVDGSPRLCETAGADFTTADQ